MPRGILRYMASTIMTHFSLVAKIASIRLIFSMVAMRSWLLYQLDIKNAFFDGDLLEEVYMEQPSGFVT